jgi:cytoskeletal protein CcmA (bactofilin family)
MLMKKTILYVILLVILSLTCSTTYALTTISADKTTGNVTIEKDQTIDDNLAVAGNNVIIRGNVKDSLFVAGSNVRIEGDIEGNLIVAGSNVIISGNIGKDAIIAGSSITIDSSSKIGRDLITAGSTVNIDGRTERNIKNGSSQININGVVNGNVDTYSPSITLGNNAKIEGTLKYHNNKEINIPNKEKVIGGIVFEQITQTKPQKSPGSFLFFNFIRLLQTLLLGLIFVLLAPRCFSKTANIVNSEPLKSFGWGILLLVAIPIIAIIVFLTIIGIPASMLLMMIYIFLMPVSYLIVAYYIGGLTGKGKWSPVVTMLIGILILWVIFLIPIISILANLIAVSLGLGAIYLSLNQLKWGRIEKRTEQVSKPTEIVEPSQENKPVEPEQPETTA